jgi:signal transduction histidine kinase
MRRSLHWLLPSRISGQIAIIITVSLVVIHTILTCGIFAGRREPQIALPPPLGTLIRLIDGVEPAARPRLMAEINRAFPDHEIALTPPGAAGGREMSEAPRPDGVRRDVGPGVRVLSLGHGGRRDGANRRVSVHLTDGQEVIASLAPPPGSRPGRLPGPPPGPPGLLAPVQMALLSLAIIMTLLGVWAARVLTAPLRAFAEAAEVFSPDAEIAPLPESGPEEIRAAARALNRMRRRIKHLVDDRMRMLAAVGHDLRTPITRLRLRSEFIDSPALRRQMLHDLAQMSDMIEQILVFLREERSPENATVIDVATSLQTICDQFIDMGHPVSYDGPDHLTVLAYACALNRAVTNLVENAIRYGNAALVRLTVASDKVVIAVEDDGPGIPDEQKDTMIEPFVRGDRARSMDGPSGFGLGLSIARAVAAAHGGSLTLRDREPRGLIAAIELPASVPPADDTARAAPGSIEFPEPHAAAAGTIGRRSSQPPALTERISPSSGRGRATAAP